MTEAVLAWFMGLLAGLPSPLIVFVVSMIPIIELRGGLIAAALLKMSLGSGLLYCMLGNMLPVPFILLFITPIFSWLKNTRLFKPLVLKLESKAMSKSEQVKKWEFWGLVLFVGIPLPGTGAWTGSLIAALLNIRFKKALPAVYLGLCLAATIMCIFTYLIPYLVANFF